MTRTAPPSDLQVLRLVAHELRAHLTVLNGYSELLTEDAEVRRDPQKVDRALTEMRTHIATLNDISTHLSQAVRGGDQARLPVAIGDVDLRSAAREALEMTEPVARRHRVRMRLDAPENLAPVRADRFQLVMAMRNLLDNACTHGPEGGGVVLELRPDGGDLVIRVHDGGSGLGRLGAAAFQPLRRGRRRRETGMGLGLSLVEQVARAHGGEVVWESDRGGSSIGLRIPVRAPA
jgi:signal transduction histidine kinase